MNEHLSMGALIFNASGVVQVVLLSLVVASVLSWALIIRHSALLRQAQRASRLFEERFWSGMNLGTLYKEVQAQDEREGSGGMERTFMVGFLEFSRLRKRAVTGNALMDGVRRAMRVAIAREQELLESSLSFLATLGSIGPYVGLFGTVVGVMNAFRGLAGVQQTTLAAVAPGIAEALVTTGAGLMAAIPAVIAYNRFGLKAGLLLNSYDTFIDEFCGILHSEVYGQSAVPPASVQGSAAGQEADAVTRPAQAAQAVPATGTAGGTATTREASRPVAPGSVSMKGI